MPNALPVIKSLVIPNDIMTWERWSITFSAVAGPFMMRKNTGLMVVIACYLETGLYHQWDMGYPLMVSTKLAKFIKSVRNVSGRNMAQNALVFIFCNKFRDGTWISLGEFVKYSWSNRGSSDVKSNEPAGTCPRELFECDREFGHNTLATHTEYKDEFHAFFGPWDNNNPVNCPKGTGGQPRECCGGHDKTYTLYNTNRLACCADGITREIGTC